MRRLTTHLNRRFLRLLPAVLIITFILSIIGPNTASANPSWYDLSWQHRKKITIYAANVTATLTDFPVLISLASDTDLAADALDNGNDILFTASNEITKLSHEIESFNGTTGKLVAWVKIPTLSSVTNTEIYMYYGNASAANQQDVTGVWDSNYKMVQHLEETAGGPGAITDSTLNNNDGTDYNTPTFGATGKIDGAITFDKASNEYIQLPASNSILNADGFTLESWIITTTNHPVYGVIPYEGRILNLHRGAAAGSAVSLYVEQNKVGLFYYTSGGASLQLTYTVNYYDGVPHHLAATHSSSDNTYRLYYDGAQVATAVDTFVGFGTYPGFIGTHNTLERSYNGIIDEARISSSARSSAWITTSYKNQVNPASFSSLGPEQNVPSAPTVTTNAATGVEEEIATLWGYLDNDGGEACQYAFEWGTAPGSYTANISWTGSINTGASFSTPLVGLTKGQPYYYRAMIKNTAGVTYGLEVHFLTKPDGPTDLTATAISSSRIDLSWTKAPSAQRTRIRRSTVTFPATYLDGTEVYFDTGTSFSDTTGLSGSTNYYYRAWSEVTGSQQFSNTFSSTNMTTFAATPPSIIGGKVFSVNKASILVPWIILGIVSTLILIRVIFYVRKRFKSRPPPEKTPQL